MCIFNSALKGLLSKRRAVTFPVRARESSPQSPWMKQPIKKLTKSCQE